MTVVGQGDGCSGLVVEGWLQREIGGGVDQSRMYNGQWCYGGGGGFDSGSRRDKMASVEVWGSRCWYGTFLLQLLTGTKPN